MLVVARAGLLAFILAASTALSAPEKAPKAPEYILDGFRLEGIGGPKIAAGLVAGLKHHAGSRVHEADIKADLKILTEELRARHITGRLFTGMAESNGHLTVFFQLVNTAPKGANLWSSRHLVSQKFEGAAGVPARDLVHATNLTPGDALTPEKIVAARKGILTLVKKFNHDKMLSLKVRIQTRPHDEAALTWIFGESAKKP